jgi:hypothetical protein
MNMPFDIEQLWNLPADQFLATAKQLCIFQAKNNPVYKQWIALSNPSCITCPESVFLSTE